MINLCAAGFPLEKASYRVSLSLSLSLGSRVGVFLHAYNYTLENPNP